jgi:uncharacterized LabA/DUF88 family protein
MIASLVTGKVCVFIDAANILYSQQTLGWRVDYTELKNYFQKECELQQIFFYTGHVGDNQSQQSFLKKLEKIGYIIKAKEVKKIRISKTEYQYKGNLDVELTIDVIANINNFDTLILMSGDSDFAPLLDLVKSHHKRVIVISTKGHVAQELLQRAKYVNLRKLREQIEFGVKIV